MADETKTGAKSLTDATFLKRRRSRFGLLGWIVGGVVIFGMVMSILLPSLCKAREPANRAKCASNLHQIGLAIAMYAQDNGGQYPPSLAVLPALEQITPAVLVCPSSNDEPASATDTAGIVTELTAAEKNEVGHKHCLSYVYKGRGLQVAIVSPTTIVAYEPLDNHQGEGTNVLFGDGHVEWVDKGAWQKLASAAGVAVVQSLATRP